MRDNIPGDLLPTHADADSIFFGSATFISGKKGATVPDFSAKKKVDAA